MKTRRVYLLLFILISGIAYAEDLSDFPGMFIKNGNFDALIVVGNKAPASHVIAQGKLALFFGEISQTPIIGKAKLATDISSLDENLIMIGSPCKNELSGFLDSYPLECSWIDSKPGIHYVDYNGYSHIIISGDDSDIKQGVDALINYQNHEMVGPQLFIKESGKPTLQENVDLQQDQLNKSEVIDELTKKISEKAAEETVSETRKGEPAENPQEPVMQESKNGVIEEKSIFTKIWEWIKSIFS